jgi:hypothetical protein
LQAGLQVPYCCQPATYVNTTWTEQSCNTATHSSLIIQKRSRALPAQGTSLRTRKQGRLKHECASTPLLIGPGTGHPGDGRRTGSLCPCGACSLVVPLPGTLSLIPQKKVCKHCLMPESSKCHGCLMALMLGHEWQHIYIACQRHVYFSYIYDCLIIAGPTKVFGAVVQ